MLFLRVVRLVSFVLLPRSRERETSVAKNNSQSLFIAPLAWSYDDAPAGTGRGTVILGDLTPGEICYLSVRFDDRRAFCFRCVRFEYWLRKDLKVVILERGSLFVETDNLESDKNVIRLCISLVHVRHVS